MRLANALFGARIAPCYIWLSLNEDLSILERLTMNKVFATTVLLGVALLFNQGANVFVAALCPHLGTPAEPCITQRLKPKASDEHLGHMQMDSIASEVVPSEVPNSQETSREVSLSLPVGSCPHCAMHSRSNSNPVSFRESETAKRASDLNAPLLVEQLIFEHETTFPILPSRAHGPPGSELPRHVLINVFRI